MTYIRLGALVAFLAVAALALWYRSEATQALAERDMAMVDLKVAEDANAAQAATIGRLRADAEANDKLIAEMVADLDAIRQEQAETTEAIGALKDASEDVRAYLGSAVPGELERLLNK